MVFAALLDLKNQFMSNQNEGRLLRIYFLQ